MNSLGFTGIPSLKSNIETPRPRYLVPNMKAYVKVKFGIDDHINIRYLTWQMALVVGKKSENDGVRVRKL